MDFPRKNRLITNFQQKESKPPEETSGGCVFCQGCAGFPCRGSSQRVTSGQPVVSKASRMQVL